MPKDKRARDDRPLTPFPQQHCQCPLTPLPRNTANGGGGGGGGGGPHRAEVSSGLRHTQRLAKVLPVRPAVF